MPRLALYRGNGVSDAGRQYQHRIFDPDPRFEIIEVGPLDILDPGLDSFDAIVIPGGRSLQQSKSLGRAGRQAICSFVEKGGGYLGICGGAYLASSDRSDRLGLVDARPQTGKIKVPGRGRLDLWFRGDKALVKIELTDAGQEMFLDRQADIIVPYHNGPVWTDFDPDSCTVLAHYRTEVVDLEQQRGIMVDSPAIVGSTFGKGRVLLISPHPEQQTGTTSMITQAAGWVSRL